MNELIPLMVIIPMICALLLNAFAGKDKTLRCLAIATAILIPIIPLVAVVGVHYFGGHNPLLTMNLLPSNLIDTAVASFNTGIVYVLHNIQKLFIFLLGIVAFLSIFTYFNEKRKISGSYLYLIFMGIAAATALLLSDDIFHMYVFFEIIALVQVGIILASSTEDKYETGIKYMLLGAIGGPMLLLGIGFVLGTIGAVNISDIQYAISNHLVSPYSPGLIIGFALILFGWLYASGLPPFHTIKSSVYSKARPNAAAILQAFSVICMITFGIVLFRIFSYLPFFKMALIIFSILAMVLGVSMALMSTDFRRMIGFLAVGELGFIGMGLGIGTQLSITAGLFQAANEIIITALLFIGFGTVYYLTKTSNTKKLGGLIAIDSRMAIMVLLGGFAMAGVPPFNGFQSKLMLVQAALNAGYPELAIIAVIVSIVTFLTFVKAFHSIYLQPKPKDLGFVHKKIPSIAVFAVGILLVICLVLGLCPGLATGSIAQFVGGMI